MGVPTSDMELRLLLISVLTMTGMAEILAKISAGDVSIVVSNNHNNHDNNSNNMNGVNSYNNTTNNYFYNCQAPTPPVSPVPAAVPLPAAATVTPPIPPTNKRVRVQNSRIGAVQSGKYSKR